MTGQRESFALIGAPVMRLTLVDACGRPLFGDRARIITEGFISANFSAQVDDGDTVSIPNANGKEIARRAAKPKHNGFTGEIECIGVQPDVANFLAAAPLVTNGKGDIAGLRVDTAVDPHMATVCIELWSETGDGEGCEGGANDEMWGWTILPLNTGGTIGDVQFQNDAINFTVQNITTKKGHQWGQGPYFVDLDNDGQPWQPDAIPSTVALQTLGVTLPPPVPSGYAIPLDDPTATPSTTATAGTPGTFTPTGSNRPETLADMDSVTASPTTAWTTGQSVLLQDGSYAYWNGTAWAAGAAA